MATLVETATVERVWGTFAEERERLFDQFQHVPYEPDSGLPLEELRAEVEGYLATHAEQPHVLRKAHVFRLLVTRGQISIDPHDWYADKLNHGRLMQKLNHAWLAVAAAGPLATEARWFEEVYRLGLAKGGLDTGHISPGWEHMFSAGLSGLLAEARARRAALGERATAEQLAFYEAVEIVYVAAIAYAARLADLAERLIPDHPEYETHLRTIAANCRQVPAHAPQTFHQALQFAWIMHELIEMEGEMVRSAGHFDRIFYPYYTADLAAGRLTPEQAQELIQFFWWKFYARTRGRENGKNFVFGGQDAAGNAISNDLTYVALRAYAALNTPDPKLSVRYVPDSPDKLYRTVADLIRQGHNSFVLMNDVPAVEGLLKRGKTLEDARTYLPIGCYEPAVDGKEAACTMNLTINLAKAVECALYDGVDPLSGVQLGTHSGDPRQFTTFEEMYQAWVTQMDFLLKRSVEYIGAHEREWPRIHPSPFLAGTIDDCLARGKDIGQGGPHYNSVGCVGMGLANTCDALLALKRVVYDERRYTMSEIITALDRDFAGDEPLRQYLLNRVPKWGNDDPEADALARRIADHYCATVHALRNARGGACQAALFSLDYQWRLGKNTGALPDGRKARTSLAPGVGAASGRDRHGVTGLIGSVTKLDFSETPNGTVLDVTLHPSAVKGEEGLDGLTGLIKTFFAQGGYAIQFNIFDVATLREAQRHPERYATLQIRVTGWSVYFVNLSPEEQEQFIIRNTHAL